MDRHIEIHVGRGIWQRDATGSTDADSLSRALLLYPVRSPQDSASWNAVSSSPLLSASSIV